MNFYIGNLIDELDINSENIEFSDELLAYIYKISQYYSIDMEKLYAIDPYDDIDISKVDLPEIINICNFILKESLLESFPERDEGNKMMSDLLKIANKALANESGLISIGD